MSWVLVFDKITVIAILLKSHPSNHYFKIDYFFKIKNSEKKIQVQNKIVADKKKKKSHNFCVSIKSRKKRSLFYDYKLFAFLYYPEKKKKGIEVYARDKENYCIFRLCLTSAVPFSKRPFTTYLRTELIHASERDLKKRRYYNQYNGDLSLVVVVKPSHSQ